MLKSWLVGLSETPDTRRRVWLALTGILSYMRVPKQDPLLKPSSPKCLVKQGPQVLGTSLHGCLFSAIQLGAPEHTVQ